MAWFDSLSTQIWIFSVGRGNAAFIRTGLNQGFILDMNATDFDPVSFVKKNLVPKLDLYKDPQGVNHKIAQAVLSHPHSDHIAQCEALSDGLSPALLTCPHDKQVDEKLNWERIKNRDGEEGIVDAYKSLYKGRTPPLQTIGYQARWHIPNLEYGIYYIRPPVCETLHPTDDNAYGNSTSIVFYLRHANNSILFPGDMTPEGMKHILEERRGTEKRYTVFDARWTNDNPTANSRTGSQPGLKSLLQQKGLTVLVAPHHGLESCYSQDLYDSMKGGKPRLVVISERRKAHENDGSTDAAYTSDAGASGLRVRFEGAEDTKTFITTKNGHHIVIVFDSSGAPRVMADKDPERLLRMI